MSAINEYLIDGKNINKQLEILKMEAYSPTLELHHQLMGQVFEDIEKKFLNGLVEQITKANPQTIRIVNLEAVATGPRKDYLSPICGGLAELIDALRGDTPVPLWPNFIKLERKFEVTGTLQNPWILPWHIVAKVDKNFKGLESGETGSMNSTSLKSNLISSAEQ